MKIHKNIKYFLSLITLIAPLTASGNKWEPEYDTSFYPDSVEARDGLKYILEDNSRAGGIPMGLYLAMTKKKTSEQNWQKGAIPGPSENSKFENFLSKDLGLDRPAKLPLDFTITHLPDGKQVGSIGCLGCHSNVINGKVYVGVLNSRFDFNGRAATVKKLSLVTYFPSKLNLNELFFSHNEVEALDAFKNYVKNYISGSNGFTYARGQNPGGWAVWRKIAAQDPYSGTLEIANPPRNGNEIVEHLKASNERYTFFDARAWWNSSKHERLFWRNEGAFSGDHLFINHFDTSLTSASDFKTEKEKYEKINAFIKSVSPPKYPKQIDTSLADKGYDLFHSKRGSCASCHGTYSVNGEFLHLSSTQDKLKYVGTDSAHADMQKKLKPLYEDYLKITKKLDLSEEPLLAYDSRPGYIAPVLSGIWITAPYFHNASVPNLEGVLDSSKRPTCWEHVDDLYNNYDVDNISVQFTKTCDPKKKPYDTRKYAASNAGHYFGDSFDLEERKALIEYLKRF